MCRLGGLAAQHVVTAASFVPALARLAAPLATRVDCVGVQVTAADAEAAAGRVAATRARVPGGADDADAEVDATIEP